MRNRLVVGLAVVLLPVLTTAENFENGVNRAIWDFSQKAKALRTTHQDPLYKELLRGKTLRQIEDDANAHLVRETSASVVMIRNGLGGGSGIVVEQSNGKTIIVTNTHVLMEYDVNAQTPPDNPRPATEVVVVLGDKSEIKATVLGVNAKYDLGFVQLNAPCGRCRTARFASAPPETGQYVAAAGDPFGLPLSYTFGRVSGLGRTSETKDFGSLVDDLIQTDAAINPGNSGGALFDRNGDVLGVNERIIGNGASSGVGFAIPIHHVARLLTRYKKSGYIAPARIGIMVQVPESKIGLRIIEILKNSPASKALLRNDDLILRIDGQDAPSSLIGFCQIIADKVPGDIVALTIKRWDQMMNIYITVDESKRQ